jgi:hypothetical protein
VECPRSRRASERFHPKPFLTVRKRRVKKLSFFKLRYLFSKQIVTSKLDMRLVSRFAEENAMFEW